MYRLCINGTCKIINKLGTNTLRIVNIDDNNSLVTDNIGSYDAIKGKLNLTNFNPSLIIGGVNFIKFSAVPQNEGNIIALRNFIFKNDTSRTITTSTIDRQGVRVAL